MSAASASLGTPPSTIRCTSQKALFLPTTTTEEVIPLDEDYRLSKVQVLHAGHYEDSKPILAHADVIAQPLFNATHFQHEETPHHIGRRASTVHHCETRTTYTFALCANDASAMSSLYQRMYLTQPPVAAVAMWVYGADGPDIYFLNAVVYNASGVTLGLVANVARNVVAEAYHSDLPKKGKKVDGDVLVVFGFHVAKKEERRSD